MGKSEDLEKAGKEKPGGGPNAGKDPKVVQAEREKRTVEQHLKVEQKLRDANRALEKALEEAEKRVKEAEAKVQETIVIAGETGATAQSALAVAAQEETTSADEAITVEEKEKKKRRRKPTDQEIQDAIRNATLAHEAKQHEQEEELERLRAENSELKSSLSA